MAVTQQTSPGTWESLSVEVRPSLSTGTLKPFYLTRKFQLSPDNTFELTVTNFADPFGEIPLVRIALHGHLEWGDAHPVVADAWQADFTADTAYAVTPLTDGFTDVLNQLATGFSGWQTGKTQSILGKAFAPFGLTEGQIFKEYDLIYVDGDRMYWGARHPDGRGFDTPENRPSNLQIPMKRI
ncbi:hypothetical protein [Siphonobacter aquaeclarae]|uniref:APCDD1 domain-containing protein n=1 Tax=Siphonobacter aquaeclarae TaxID=563176 RepID=A0A1G9K300_9BACT|nr:hypothetical protein [Siphonobacter aquaeclarae]SDL43784.1 hypothetical protein SAMN04488090_0847 [Siphonobacter aquaeclarae]